MSLPLPPDAPPHAGARSPDAAYAGVYVATWLVLNVLVTSQLALSSIAFGTPLHVTAFAPARLFEVAGFLASVPALLALRRRVPAERVGLTRHLAVVLAGMLVVVAAASLAGYALWQLTSGGRGVFKGSMAAKVISEYVVTAASVTVATSFALHRRLREREAHALRLEASLADARLRALASQLHPHFLFNTLNAAATLLHRDAGAADAMLTRLADLLRATLRQPTAHEIPLRDEMALLGRYVDIMRIRYGPRLTVDVCAPPELHDLLVPAFVLQPLVENALEHGVARRAGPGKVAIRVARVDGVLRLEVADDGPGPDARAGEDDPEDEGIGLPNTRRRLRQLYGDAQRLTLAHAPGVGTFATVELPARAAVEPAAHASGAEA